MNFEIKYLANDFDINDDNCDVNIYLENKRVFFGTLFTPMNIHTLIARFRKSGECLNGKYFWSANMLIVENLERSTVDQVINELIENGGFFEIFTEIPNPLTLQ